MSRIRKRVLHPGYHIKEYIEATDIDVNEFASEIGIDKEELKLVLSYKIPITLDMANKLSARIGTSVDFWLRLQANYDAYINNLSKYK